MYDLVIVGSGPAGSTCARVAALAGLDVILIERKKHPRPKLCGGAINPRINRLIDFDLSAAIDVERNAAKVISPQGNIVTAARQDFKGYLVKRAKFDSFLLDKARQVGVEVIEGEKVISVEQLKRGVRALVKGDSFKGHILVGADGVNSTVAKALNIRKQWKPENVTLCIAADVPLEPSEISRIMRLNDNDSEIAIEMYLGVLKWGFGWCFPKHDEVSIGIGARMDKVKNLRIGWTNFIERLEKEKDVKFDISNRSAHRIPFGDTAARYSGRRSMLVGDAAGFVSPITGEGIYYAMLSGIVAAEVAIETVKQKKPLHVRTYDERIKAKIGGELRIARSISNMLYKSPNNVEMVCKLANDDDIIRDLIIDLVTGNKSYSIVRRELVKRLIKSHPLKALSLGLSL